MNPGGRHLAPYTPVGGCGYCGRRFGDRRGCEYDEDPTPTPFGDEGYGIPGDRCPACLVNRGALHHAVCSLAECAGCGARFSDCGGDCERGGQAA